MGRSCLDTIEVGILWQVIHRERLKGDKFIFSVDK